MRALGLFLLEALTLYSPNVIGRDMLRYHFDCFAIDVADKYFIIKVVERQQLNIVLFRLFDKQYDDI